MFRYIGVIVAILALILFLFDQVGLAALALGTAVAFYLFGTFVWDQWE